MEQYVGEMTAEDMEASMMNKTERHLEILTISDAEAAKASIEMLMGNDVDSRKRFLFDNVDFNSVNK